MNDPSVTHEPHNFLAYDNTTQDKIRTRSSLLPPKDKEAKSDPAEDSKNESVYVVKTLYTYDYRNLANEQVGFLESEKPRSSTVPKRKGIRLDPKGSEIPVVTKKVTIETDLKADTKLTKYDLDSYDPRNGDVEIDINSPMVLNALRAIIDYYPGWDLWDESLRSLIPLAQLFILFNHRQSLLDYKTHHPPCHDAEYIAECNQHIDEVVRFLNQEFKEELDVENRWTQGDLTVSFDNLGCLFLPGQQIYSRMGDQLDPYICTSWGWNDKQFMVHGWNVDFDGSTFGRANRVFTIEKFLGRKKITALDVFPPRFYNESESESAFRKRRIESGRKFCKIVKTSSYMEYSGVTRDVPEEKVGTFQVFRRIGLPVCNKVQCRHAGV